MKKCFLIAMLALLLCLVSCAGEGSGDPDSTAGVTDPVDESGKETEDGTEESGEKLSGVAKYFANEEDVAITLENGRFEIRMVIDSRQGEIENEEFGLSGIYVINRVTVVRGTVEEKDGAYSFASDKLLEKMEVEGNNVEGYLSYYKKQIEGLDQEEKDMYLQMLGDGCDITNANGLREILGEMTYADGEFFAVSATDKNNGAVIRRIDYEQGIPTSMSYFDKDGDVEQLLEYNEDGKVIKTSYFDGETLHQEILYTYDEEGREIKQENYVEGTLFQKRERTYDENGTLIKLVSYDEGLHYTEEYDAQGNLIKSVMTGKDDTGEESEDVTTIEYDIETGHSKHSIYDAETGITKVMYFDENGSCYREETI